MARENDCDLIVGRDLLEKALHDPLRLDDPLLEDVQVVDDEHPLTAVRRVGVRSDIDRGHRRDGIDPAACRRDGLEPEIGDALHAAALGDREVVFRQVLDGHVVPIGHDDVELDVVDAAAKHGLRCLGWGGLARECSTTASPSARPAPAASPSHIAM